MTLETLDNACKDALPVCERVIDRLGFEMTVGGEIEWYALLPDAGAKLTQRQAADEIVKIAERKPGLFHQNSVLPPEPILMKRLIEKLGKKNPNAKDAAMAWTQEITHQHIAYKQPLMIYTDLLSMRVIERMELEGIALNRAHYETGGFNSAVTLVAPDHHTYAATGKQMEISLAHTTPAKLAHAMERVHTIIAEESAAIGLIADFRRVPPYLLRESESVLPTNSQHIHFGLVIKNDGTNAFTQHGDSNALSEACSKSTLRVLSEGGQLLANPTDNDFRRMKMAEFSTTIAHKIENGYGDKSRALMELHYSDKGVEHKELRIAGGNTPASAAILIAALGVADGLLSSIGKGAPVARRGLFSRAQEQPSLEQKLEAISDEDRRLIARQCATRVDLPEMRGSPTDYSVAEAKKRLVPSSIIAHYTPEVFRQLQQLEGLGLAV